MDEPRFEKPRLIERRLVSRNSPVAESRTDLLIAKMKEELEKQRVWLDRIPGLRSVSIDVKLIAETGRPRVAILRTESEN